VAVITTLPGIILSIITVLHTNVYSRSNLLEGIPSKVYIYHILTAHKAASQPTMTLTSSRLNEVSQEKRDAKPLTILHKCGHKWCMNEDHYDIGPKCYNEEQTSCHRGLQSSTIYRVQKHSGILLQAPGQVLVHCICRHVCR